ncbi:MAG TPA: hypothetical protein VOA80_24715 [Thermoanaerobaculia bacterium]|nr:hypothetical protein [Thermoanaerobaculia bacterium]
MFPVAELAAAAVIALVPYLKMSAGSIAARLGTTAAERLTGLYDKVKGHLNHSGQAALADLEQTPDHTDSQATLRQHLRKQLPTDLALQAALSELVEALQSPDTAQVFQTATVVGDGNSNIQIFGSANHSTISIEQKTVSGSRIQSPQLVFSHASIQEYDWTDKRYISFTLSNVGDGIVFLEQIELEVLACSMNADLGFHQPGAQLVPVRLGVHLKPGTNKYLLTTDPFSYQPAETDLFKIELSSDEGVRYVLVFNLYWRDVTSQSAKTLRSRKYELSFPLRSLEAVEAHLRER